MPAKSQIVMQAAVDVDEAECFLAIIGPKAKRWTFQTVDDSEESDGALAKILHGTLDEHMSTLMQLSKHGAGIFATLNRTDLKGRRKENIRRVRAVCLDLDGPSLDLVMTCKLKPHVIVESSPRRFHVYWCVRKLPLHEFEGVQRAIAKAFDGDPAVAKLTHIARLPGFDHRKSDPYRVRIVKTNDMPAYTTEQIVEEFPPLDKPHKPPLSRPGVMLPKGAYVMAAEAFVERKFARDGVNGLVAHRGIFYRWTGTHYQSMGRRNLRSCVYEFLNDCWAVNKEDVQPYNPTRAKVSEVLGALEAGLNEDEDHDMPFWLPPLEHMGTDGFIACRNGLLNIETGKLSPHDPHFLNTRCVPFDYDPDAPEPKQWVRFLQQLWPDDKPARLTLAEIFGYMLSADNSQQKIFMIVGPMRSGKGTIGRVLTALLGRDNVANPTLSSMTGEFGLWPLINKRVAIISDARISGRTITSVVVERLLNISGEDDQTINRKNQSFWTGRLGLRFLILTNELPSIKDASRALASRFIILMLRENFLGREDTRLTRKLLKELPGILNWSLHGFDRLQDRGEFKMLKSSIDAVRTLEDLSSPVGAFLRDCCEVGPGKRVNVKVLFGAYKVWCEAKGERVGSDRVFGRDLRAAAPHVATGGSGKDRHYKGVGLSDYGQKKYDLAGGI